MSSPAPRRRTSDPIFRSEAVPAAGTGQHPEALVPDIPLPMWVYDIATLRVSAVNGAALRAYGYSRSEFLALTVDRLRPAEHRAVFIDHVGRAGGVPTRCRVRHRTRDGRVIHVDVVAEPATVGGRPARRVIVVDAGKSVEAEDECARLSHAVEQAAEAIMITDPAGTVLYVNPAFERVSGYSRKEAVGANPRFLKSGQQDAAFYESMWATLQRGDVWRGRLINRHKDGTLFEEEATISPVRDDGGLIRSYVAVKRDVSRERHLEEQVRHSMKMEAVGRLAGGVAHDFNNLLNVIAGYAELGLRRLPPQTDTRRHVTEILRATERASALTRQLLTFSRKQVVQPRVIDLNGVLRDMDRLLRRLIGEDVELIARTADKPLSLRADAGQIEQVIMNLAVNARDAMPEGGRLVLRTAAVDVAPSPAADVPAGRYVELSVTDTGCGMDGQTASRIFEPFFTTKPEGRGTGLGLSTVWGIVTNSGGTVTVRSELGAGTTFRILLPRVESPVDVDASPAIDGARPAHPASAGTRAHTVLVVDDEAPLRAIVRDVLEDSGYRVLEAGDAAAALALAAEHQGPLELLLTDVNMPGRDGAELASRMRELRPGLRVVFMSGEVDHPAPDGDAAHGFLSKPFTAAMLEQAVRDVLAPRAG